MSDQVIPGEAVEAAAQAWVARKLQPGNWTQEDSALAALEAAAPLFMAGAAQAWHDAVSAVYVEGAISAAAADVLYARNPYRKAIK